MGAHRKCRALCFVRRCVPYQKKGDRADVRKVLASADATELASSRPRIAELTSEIENLAELAAKTGQADVYARLIGDRESERRVLQDAVRQATTVPVDFPALRSSMVKRVREMRGWFVEAGDDARHALQMLLGDRRLAVHHDDEYSVADRGILQGAGDSSGSRALDPRRGARDWQSFGGSGGRIRTCDLRVMSPTSYLTALPRINLWCFGSIRETGSTASGPSPPREEGKVYPCPKALSTRGCP